MVKSRNLGIRMLHSTTSDLDRPLCFSETRFPCLSNKDPGSYLLGFEGGYCEIILDLSLTPNPG